MTGPKVTAADLEAAIKAEYFFKPREHIEGPAHAELGTLTICVLILDNGCKVVGINHGPVDPAGFDSEHGRKDAREDAIRQVWPLLGFRLRDRLNTAVSWFNEPGKIGPKAWEELDAGMVSQLGVPANLHGADHHSADALSYLMQGERERQHQLNTERSEVMAHVAKAEAPAPSAADLAEGIADAAAEYHAAREQERIAQQSLDMMTESRRRRLVEVVEATAAREKAAEKMLAASNDVWRCRPCGCGDKESCSRCFGS